MNEAEQARERIVEEYKAACREYDPSQGPPIVTYKAGWFQVRRSQHGLMRTSARARELVSWTLELRRRMVEREK